MTGLIAKILAYLKYPRRTFMLLHPLRAAKFGIAYLAGRRLFGRGTNGRDGGRRGPQRRPGGAARRRRTGGARRRPADPPRTR